MKKYSRQDQTTMAAWAADCAERVLPLFEVAYPGDEQSKEKRNGAHGNLAAAISRLTVRMAKWTLQVMVASDPG